VRIEIVERRVGRRSLLTIAIQPGHPHAASVAARLLTLGQTRLSDRWLSYKSYCSKRPKAVSIQQQPSLLFQLDSLYFTL
jgi:hypothetical protein